MSEFYNTKSQNQLFEFLKFNKDNAYSAKELLGLLPDIPKATIYRKLDALCVSKKVRKTYNEAKLCTEYQYSEHCGSHLHLKCSRCNKLIHLDCIKADSLIGHINKIHGFSINLNDSIILGLCKECE